MTTTEHAATRDVAADQRRLLRIYLNDHRAGGAGGKALAERLRDSNADRPLGATLDTLVAEIEEDARALESVMGHLGVRANPIKVAAAQIGERVGRIKPNGRVRAYSPLSRVLEIEAMMAAIDMKRRLWESLLAMTAGDQAGGIDLARLAHRADQQRERLQSHHDEAVVEAFGHL